MRRPEPPRLPPRAAAPAKPAPAKHPQGNTAQVNSPQGNIAVAPAAARAEVVDVVTARPAEPEAPRAERPAADAGVAADAAEPPAGAREVWRAARARRKALRGEVRRFTARSRRRRLTWAAVLGILALLVAGTVGVAFSPLFAVGKITVEGTLALPAADVEAALAGQLGTPLASVDEESVRSALGGFALVESFSLEARPPHELVVRIVERTPIGAVHSDAGWQVVDAAGVVLQTTPDRPGGLAEIAPAGGVGTPAFTALAEVMHALPDSVRSQVSSASASGLDDVVLTLQDGRTTVVWGSVDESPQKALVLDKVMTARPPSTTWCYDVSTPRAVAVCGD